MMEYYSVQDYLDSVESFAYDPRNTFASRVAYLMGRSKKNKWKKNRRKSK